MAGRQARRRRARRPQLRHRRGARDALRPRGGPVLRGRGDHRTAPRRQGRRALRCRGSHRRRASPRPARPPAARRSRTPPRATRTAPAARSSTGGCTCTPSGCPGLVAHQEVLLGNDGELLTIKHDSHAPFVLHAGRADRCPRRSGSARPHGRPRTPAGPVNPRLVVALLSAALIAYFVLHRRQSAHPVRGRHPRDHRPRRRGPADAAASAPSCCSSSSASAGVPSNSAAGWPTRVDCRSSRTCPRGRPAGSTRPPLCRISRPPGPRPRRIRRTGGSGSGWPTPTTWPATASGPALRCGRRSSWRAVRRERGAAPPRSGALPREEPARRGVTLSR